MLISRSEYLQQHFGCDEYEAEEALRAEAEEQEDEDESER